MHGESCFADTSNRGKPSKSSACDDSHTLKRERETERERERIKSLKHGDVVMETVDVQIGSSRYGSTMTSLSVTLRCRSKSSTDWYRIARDLNEHTWVWLTFSKKTFKRHRHRSVHEKTNLSRKPRVTPCCRCLWFWLICWNLLFCSYCLLAMHFESNKAAVILFCSAGTNAIPEFAKKGKRMMTDYFFLNKWNAVDEMI